MKRRFVDPFFPNRPVDDPLRFAGRREQVEEVIDALFQILNSNPKHSIITGDRGIGKSSLLLQTKLLASGDNRLAERLKLDLGVESYKFATVWHDCDKEQNVQGLINGLTKEFESKLHGFLGNFNFKLNVLKTLEVSNKDSSLECISEIVNAFVGDIKKAHDRLSEKGYNGIIFFIDELDRVDPSSGVASFFKLASERMARENYKNVAFIAAGISGAIQKLGVFGVCGYKCIA
ncbi:ATP-binding protein [Baaleninema simplex]|uniref:ATP-binding protein n=1 Tax=Baaleninema simplex TaxID=2862350 RepID=UPI000371D783|nr:ATP-binding protein [Baaleninema simplex]